MKSMIKKSLQNALVAALAEKDESRIPDDMRSSFVFAEDIEAEQAYKDITDADSICNALVLCGEVMWEWGDRYEKGYGWCLARAMSYTIDNMSIWTKEEQDG